MIRITLIAALLIVSVACVMLVTRHPPVPRFTFLTDSQVFTTEGYSIPVAQCDKAHRCAESDFKKPFQAPSKTSMTVTQWVANDAKNEATVVLRADNCTYTGRGNQVDLISQGNASRQWSITIYKRECPSRAPEFVYYYVNPGDIAATIGQTVIAIKPKSLVLNVALHRDGRVVDRVANVVSAGRMTVLRSTHTNSAGRFTVLAFVSSDSQGKEVQAQIDTNRGDVREQETIRHLTTVSMVLNGEAVVAGTSIDGKTKVMASISAIPD